MYAMAMGRCINCSRIFGFNPHKVPSIRLNGTKEPICRDCIKDLNAVRVAHGVPEWTIHPDAYEPVDENEL
jgi:hypothetical protein